MTNERLPEESRNKRLSSKYETSMVERGMEAARILIVGDFPFPDGSASAERVRHLALGFVKCGARVHLVACSPRAKKGQVGEVIQFSESVSYEYLQGPLEGGSSFSRKLNWFLGRYLSSTKLAARIDTILAQHDFEFGYCYGTSGVVMKTLQKALSRRGVLSLLDVNEIRSQFRGAGGAFSPIAWDWWYLEEYVMRRFSGIVGIASEVSSYVKRKGVVQSLVVPATSDWESLPKNDENQTSATPKLVYVGTLVERDAPDQIERLVRAAAVEGWPIRVVLVGRFAAYADGRKNFQKISEADPTCRVLDVQGAVSSEEMEALLSGADGFIHTRADRETERCSFPTRLVEFLANGKPVFVSNVGDIAKYLTHGKDALLLDPNDPNSLRDSVKQFLDSRSRHASIGVEGFLTGKQDFCRARHAKRIIDFAQQLKNLAESAS